MAAFVWFLFWLLGKFVFLRKLAVSLVIKLGEAGEAGEADDEIPLNRFRRRLCFLPRFLK
eukprot:m.119675 g.119675  ORF g.119675 m.119675 type:complete len:60 (-) comp12911_c0_seq2:448-627(-)